MSRAGHRPEVGPEIVLVRNPSIRSDALLNRSPAGPSAGVAAATCADTAGGHARRIPRGTAGHDGRGKRAREAGSGLPRGQLRGSGTIQLAGVEGQLGSPGLAKPSTPVLRSSMVYPTPDGLDRCPTVRERTVNGPSTLRNDQSLTHHKAVRVGNRSPICGVDPAPRRLRPVEPLRDRAQRVPGPYYVGPVRRRRLRGRGPMPTGLNGDLSAWSWRRSAGFAQRRDVDRLKDDRDGDRQEHRQRQAERKVRGHARRRERVRGGAQRAERRARGSPPQRVARPREIDLHDARNTRGSGAHPARWRPAANRHRMPGLGGAGRRAERIEDRRLEPTRQREAGLRAAQALTALGRPAIGADEERAARAEARMLGIGGQLVE
jgi:hypothetical protein